MHTYKIIVMIVIIIYNVVFIMMIMISIEHLRDWLKEDAVISAISIFITRDVIILLSTTVRA